MRISNINHRRCFQGLALGLASFFLCGAQDNALAPATDIYNKALRLYENAKWGAAKEYFHQYLAEYSDSPLYVTCLYYLAYCYQQLSNAQEAMSIYHKVIDEAKDGDLFWAEMAEKRIGELNL